LETSACIICNSINASTFLKIHDRLKVTDDLFELKKCECGLVFLDPRPTIQEMDKYYDSQSYDPHNVEGKNMWNKVFKKIQFFTSCWKKIIIKNHAKRGNLLDVGGGESVFPSLMSKAAWNITVQDKFFFHDKNNQFKTINDLNALNASNQFDAITLWHSLEHIHDIKELFNNLSKLISKNGTLFIAVPNFNAHERKKYGSDWAPYDVPRHLYHFTPKSLNLLLNNYGFHVVKQKGLMQDAFYNITLSMKYTLKGFVTAIMLLFKIIFLTLIFGPMHSSSFLFICKKK
jgi:hypothetical protein